VSTHVKCLCQDMLNVCVKICQMFMSTCAKCLCQVMPNVCVKICQMFMSTCAKCLCQDMPNVYVNMCQMSVLRYAKCMCQHISKLLNVINVLWIEHETILVRVKLPNYQLLAVALHLVVVKFWIGVRSRWRTGRAPSLPKLVQGRLFFLYKEIKYRKYVKWMKYDFFNSFSISSEKCVMLDNI
jgi:hypothetical protein